MNAPMPKRSVRPTYGAVERKTILFLLAIGSIMAVVLLLLGR